MLGQMNNAQILRLRQSENWARAGVFLAREEITEIVAKLFLFWMFGVSDLALVSLTD